MDAPLLSIGIPTFNRLRWLKACLEACIPQAEALQPGLVEIVVAENPGSDGSWAFLQEQAREHACLRIRRNEYDCGAENFNVVVQEARGRYVWLMGDDDAPLPGGVAKLVDLIRAGPRDIYLLHSIEVDLEGKPLTKREWFSDLPKLDWDLTDRAELIDYLDHAQYMAAAFAFISILVVDREAWIANGTYIWELGEIGWTHVGRALQMIRTRGRVRVVEEALLQNTAGNDGRDVTDPFGRAMWDLHGWIRLADTFFPDDPELAGAFMGPLRRNRQNYLIRHLRNHAPSQAEWDRARVLLLRAGISEVAIRAHELGLRIVRYDFPEPLQLEAGTLCLADLGFIARGSRRVLVMAARGQDKEVSRLLDALRARTMAEIRLLVPAGTSAPAAADQCRVSSLPVDLAKVAGDPAYRRTFNKTLMDWAPDLVINTDPERRPGWDILASAAGGAARVAFQAGERPVAAEFAAWLDSAYTQLLPRGPVAGLAAALGMTLPEEPEPRASTPPPPPAPVPQAPAIPLEGPMKLNLGCGQEHLAGWVNVDQFPGSQPDLVHDLEKFPWPFQDGSATEVLLKHVLEHLGRDSETFLGIIKELYRVCAPGARVRILVPHPRHRDFLQDPTHVRPVLAEMFEHFSLEINEDWIRRGMPGTPLAVYLGLDFAIESATLNLDPWWDAEFRAGRITRDQLERAARDCNNVIATTEVVLRACKPFKRAQAPAATAKGGVRWEGSQFVHHSLAHVNRQLCLGLLREPAVDLSIIPYEPDQFDGAKVPAFRPLAARVNKALAGQAVVHVRHQWPPRFEPPPQGAWVMIQPWEFGGIPAEWVTPMRDQVDEIWVPSAWLKDCYVRSGIPADQVVVVPNGVDCDVFRPEGKRFPLKTARGCKFLFLGGTIHRKGFDLLLDTYIRTFRASDDVCLVVKEQGGGVYGTPGLPEQLRKLREEDPTAPDIEYRTDDLTEPQVASLYRACDVLVLPYRGEGFGLPIAEAMASGLPVLVTGRGGAQDFAREPWAYLVPSTPVAIPAPGGFSPSRAGFWLEEPDAGALAGLMRRAYADPGERRRMGALGRKHAEAELGWARPVALVRARLAELAGRTPRRFAPAETAPASPEAFLYTPDWQQAEWVEVLLSFLLAFKPGEPVTLVLPWAGTAGEPTLREVQGKILELAKGAGLQAFPDVALVDQPEDLQGFLEGFSVVTPVPAGRGSGAGLVGASGLRLAAARARLCQARETAVP